VRELKVGDGRELIKSWEAPETTLSMVVQLKPSAQKAITALSDLLDSTNQEPHLLATDE